MDIATYLKIGDEYQAISAASTIDKLPAGIFEASYNKMTDVVTFQESKNTHDQLVNLPGTAYDLVLSQLDYFLTPECKERHEFVGLLHKMNILLYGPPGSGKSCIINRVAQRTVEEGGLVLFNPSPRSLQKVFRVLDTLQPETRVLVIFEEIDQLIKDHGEGPFLHVLDGEVQKHNAMFIATTNYYDQVPNRIKRPGRFAVRSYVGYPSFIAREFYCFTKLKHAETAGRIAELTENFSIDQLKEVIRETYCMNKPLTQVIENLRTEFQIPTEAGEEQGNYVEDSSEDDDDDSDDEYEGN